MLLIQGFTDDTNQKQTLVLPDGTSMDLTILYIPMQYGWFIQELVYGDFTLSNHRIVTSPNILHQYKNRIPFGLACITQDSLEPTQQNSFASGYATLYLMTEDDVAEFSEILASG